MPRLFIMSLISISLFACSNDSSKRKPDQNATGESNQYARAPIDCSAHQTASQPITQTPAATANAGNLADMLKNVDIQKLLNDPQLKSMLSQVDLNQMVASGDISQLLSDPSMMSIIQGLLANPAANGIALNNPQAANQQYSNQPQQANAAPVYNQPQGSYNGCSQSYNQPVVTQ